MRNHRPDLNGVLNIDKPMGWSSAKACAFIRRRTGGAKVGHAGTLDPLATGVLVVCLGRATKAVPALMDADKRYTASVDLSAFTTTDDAEGDRTEVPLGPDGPPPRDAIVRLIAERFIGAVEQRPPAYSAIKIGGERSYKLARTGRAPSPRARIVRIDAVAVLAYRYPALELDVRCGKGVYIRSLARDLGAALGTGGTLAGLVRTRVGPYAIDAAIAPEDLPETIDPDALLPTPRPPSAPSIGPGDRGGTINSAAP